MRSLINRVYKKVFKYQLATQPVPITSQTALRLIYFYEHLKKIESVPGDIVECGVGWGRSLYAFCLFSPKMGLNRPIHAFDSFQGFPEPTTEDNPERFNIKKGRYSTRKQGVIQFLKNSGISDSFLKEQVTFVEGFFKDTLSNYSGGPVAFLHLDVDLYSSYKETLEYFYPRMSKGGIIAFDEYQVTEKFPGAKKAIDEFFKGREPIQKSPMIDRYFIVKH